MAKNCETQHSHHHPSMHTQGHTQLHGDTTHTHTHGVPASFVPTLLSLAHIHSFYLSTQKQTTFLPYRMLKYRISGAMYLYLLLSYFYF